MQGCLQKKLDLSGLEPEAFSLLTKRDTSYTINPTKGFGSSETQATEKESQSRIVFIDSEHLSNSFVYWSSLNAQIGSIKQEISKKRQCYFELVDHYGFKIDMNQSVKYYQELVPFRIRSYLPYIASSRSLPIFVKDISQQKMIPLSIGDQELIEQVKFRIQQLHHYPFYRQTLLFNSRVLQNSKNIAFYSVKSNDVVFLYLTYEEKVVPQAEINTEEGLALKAKCHNTKCSSFDKQVSIPKRFGIYDIFRDKFNSFCPFCNMQVQGEQLCLKNCLFKFIGMKNHRRLERKGWNTSPESQTTEMDIIQFEQEGWQSLKLLTTPLKENREDCCELCQEGLTSLFNSCEEGHQYHQHCKAVLDDLGIECCTCISKQSDQGPLKTAKKALLPQPYFADKTADKALLPQPYFADKTADKELLPQPKFSQKEARFLSQDLKSNADNLQTAFPEEEARFHTHDGSIANADKKALFTEAKELITQEKYLESDSKLIIEYAYFDLNSSKLPYRYQENSIKSRLRLITNESDQTIGGGYLFLQGDNISKAWIFMMKSLLVGMLIIESDLVNSQQIVLLASLLQEFIRNKGQKLEMEIKLTNSQQSHYFHDKNEATLQHYTFQASSLTLIATQKNYQQKLIENSQTLYHNNIAIQNDLNKGKFRFVNIEARGPIRFSTFLRNTGLETITDSIENFLQAFEGYSKPHLQ